ncbi:MAG: hypothetical protein ACE5OR_01180 [bacterium]
MFDKDVYSPILFTAMKLIRYVERRNRNAKVETLMTKSGVVSSRKIERTKSTPPKRPKYPAMRAK